MKILPIQLCVVLITFLFSYKEIDVAAQIYGNAPVVYSKRDDDDFGLLLTVLLLAAKKRNCGGSGRYNGCSGRCGCCNCCSKNIAPYPVPFLIKPIIRKSDEDDDEDDRSRSKSRASARVNVDSSGDEESSSDDD